MSDFFLDYCHHLPIPFLVVTLRQRFKVLYFADAREESPRFVECDLFGLFHLFENAIILNQNSALCGQIQDNGNDTRNSESQGTRTGSHKNTNTSFENPAKITLIYIDFSKL